MFFSLYQVAGTVEEGEGAEEEGSRTRAKSTPTIRTTKTRPGPDPLTRRLKRWRTNWRLRRPTRRTSSLSSSRSAGITKLIWNLICLFLSKTKLGFHVSCIRFSGEKQLGCHASISTLGNYYYINNTIPQRFIMLLSEHLNACDSSGRDLNTHWYRWTIGRLQQVFMLHNTQVRNPYFLYIYIVFFFKLKLRNEIGG